MKSETLREFFQGRSNERALFDEAEEAARDLQDVSDKIMKDNGFPEHHVTAADLVRLCDAVLAGRLQPCHLEIIAHAMVMSDNFTWEPMTKEGKPVSKVIYSWEAPEINYALSLATVRKFRQLLLTGDDLFTDADWSE